MGGNLKTGRDLSTTCASQKFTFNFIHLQLFWYYSTHRVYQHIHHFLQILIGCEQNVHCHGNDTIEHAQYAPRHKELARDDVLRKGRRSVGIRHTAHDGCRVVCEEGVLGANFDAPRGRGPLSACDCAGDGVAGHERESKYGDQLCVCVCECVCVY